MTENSYQRIAREQKERRAELAKNAADIAKADKMARRKAVRQARFARRERAYLDALVSDHNHDMDY